MSNPINGRDLLQILSVVASNRKCADCTHTTITHFTGAYGTLICNTCASIHKKLSVVSHLFCVDAKIPIVVAERIAKIGNELSNAYFEQNLPMTSRRPLDKSPPAVKELYIRNKYEHKSYVGRRESPVISLRKTGDPYYAFSDLGDARKDSEDIAQRSALALEKQMLERIRSCAELLDMDTNSATQFTSSEFGGKIIPDSNDSKEVTNTTTTTTLDVKDPFSFLYKPSNGIAKPNHMNSTIVPGGTGFDSSINQSTLNKNDLKGSTLSQDIYADFFNNGKKESFTQSPVKATVLKPIMSARATETSTSHTQHNEMVSHNKSGNDFDWFGQFNFDCPPTSESQQQNQHATKLVPNTY